MSTGNFFCHRALVNYYWTNLPLVLLTLAQALGALVGRPTIRNGLPSTGHLQQEPWLVRKVLHPEATTAGLVCPWAMGRRPNSLILDAVGNMPLLSAWPAGHFSCMPAIYCSLINSEAGLEAVTYTFWLDPTQRRDDSFLTGRPDYCRLHLLLVRRGTS